jgi:hypothetical protein
MLSKQQLVYLGLGRQLRQQKVTNRSRKLQVTAPEFLPAVTYKMAQLKRLCFTCNVGRVIFIR